MRGTIGTSQSDRRERKKQATRHAIRQAALRLALERGVDRFTVWDVSEAVDIAPRTFFNYFGCKEDALVGEDVEATAKLREAVEARPQDEATLCTVRAVLHEAAGTYAAFHDRQEARARQQLVRDNPSLLPYHLAKFTAIERALTDALARRSGADPDRELRPALLAALAVTVMRVAVQRWSTDGACSPSEYIDEAFDLLASGEW